MTEYTAKCSFEPADEIHASTSHEGDRVRLAAFERGSHRVAYVLKADGARTFARGILALADEIDGGEAPEPAPARTVKVGDKLRVTEHGLHDAEVDAGDVLTVRYVSQYGYGFETAGEGWVFEDRHIGNGLEFVDDETDPDALKAGDRVVVVRDDPIERTGEFVGLEGTLDRDPAVGTTPYKVRFGDGYHGTRDGWWFCAEVRRIDVDEPTTAPTSVATPRRLAALKEATALLGYDAPDPDAVTLARFLLED